MNHDCLPDFFISKRIDVLLDQWTSDPLTIVEAPMGYGQRTAVRQYFKNRGIKPVWLSFHLQSDFSIDWEKGVLPLMAKGLKRDSIARRLFVSSVTVKTHLQHIYKKLDVKGKNAAINTALQNGLLDRE